MANRDPFSTPTHYSNDDFFGNNIPPPHRLPGNFPPSNTSPVNPSSSFAPHDAAARGAYAPAPTNYNPGPATSSAPMTGYQDIDTGAGEQQPYQWQEKSTGNGVAGSRRKMFIIGGIVGLLVIIGVAVGVGVGVANSNKGNTSNRSSSGSPPGTSVSGDPSNFPKDSRLHQVFYGFAYTPEGSQLPNCGNNLTEVIQDIQLLSQLTTRIRLYGADCNQSALVLEAIKQTKVDMQVFLGNYPDPTDGGAAYVRQRDIIIDAIKTYGTDHIAGITVGNEFVLNYLTSQGNSDSALANQAQGNAAAAVLIPNITDTRTQIGALGLSKNIPIGNAEAGAYFNNEILAAVDYGMANVHPWFADVSIDQAASWTFGYFQETDVTPAQAIKSNITMYIAETGWPTASDSAAAQTNGPSQANTAGLQEFMNNFVCQANANNTGYFFFEFTDEPWKAAQFGGVEGHWGLFNSDRTLKDVTIPSC